MTSPPTAAEVPRAQVRIDWRIAVACTVFLIVVFAVLAIPVSDPKAPSTARAVLQPQIIMWGLWLLLTPLVFAVARRAHALGVVTPRALALHVCAGALIAALHGVLWGIVRWNFNPGNARDISNMVWMMVSFLYGGDLLRYTLIAAAYHSFAYRAEANERRVAEARLTARLAQARLEALEARLHPHFLFNTLNTIASLIRSDPAAAQSVVEHLGDLLRAALNAEPGREVTLAAELQLLEQYVAIQQVRFSDRLTVSINAAPDALGARVPQMVLQPFVENAILHGIAPREAAGRVRVDATRRNGMLRLTVRDDGVGFGRAPLPRGQRAGIGINNTRERLTELYGEHFLLDVAADSPSGTIATIELPFHTGANAS